MAAPDSSSPASPTQDSTGLIAPGWHTAVLLGFLVGISAFETWNMANSPSVEFTSRARIASYLIGIGWEWAMVGFIAWGVRRCGRRLSDLIAGSWPDPAAFLRDLGIGVLFQIASGIVLGTLRIALRDTTSKSVRSLLPDSPTEMAIWILLSVTAGFCEETIFRGYLQKQFTRLTGSAAVGIVLQALIFGACHGYQGIKPILVIGVYGGLFGVLAHYVKNLRPGMLAHFLQDSIAGLAGRALLKHLPSG